jgi:hypothetical protein
MNEPARHATLLSQRRKPNQEIHMQKSILFSLSALVASSLIAAESTPKDDVSNAAKKLGEKPNYAWKTTIVVPDDAPFKPGPTEGKTEKEGLTYVTMSFFDNKLQAIVKGKKGAATNQEGAWKSLDELDKEEGPGRFLAVIVSNIKTPANENSPRKELRHFKLSKHAAAMLLLR